MNALAARPGDPEALAKLEALLAAPAHRLGAAQALRKLQQPHLVFGALTRALEASPDDPTLQQQAEEVAVEVDAVDALVEVLAEQVERTTGLARAALHLRLASLCELRLSNPQAAIEHLRAAAAASPRDVAPLQALRRLHHQRKEWAALAETLERLARLQATLEDQLATWRAAARVHEEHLHDERSSLAGWLRVLDLAPDDREGLEALQGLATSLDRPVDLARSLTRQRAAASGERRWALGLQLAELQASRLQQREEAVQSCGEILRSVPAHPEARAWVRRLVSEPGPVGAAAVAALGAALERTGEADAQLQLLEQRLERAAAPERAALLAAIERVSAKLPGGSTQALLKALKAFADEGDRLGKLPLLLRLAEQADALDELAEAVETASEETSDEAQTAELLRFVARLREQLKQPQPAKVLWNDLLALRPQDPEALDHLFKLFKQSGEAKSAADVGLRRARLVTGPDRIERLLEAATLYEDAGAVEGALDALEESLVAGSDLRALKAIVRLQADGSRPALHARALDALARLEPATGQGKLHLRRGQLLKGPDPVAAAGAFSRALECGGVTAEALLELQLLLTTAGRVAAAHALEPIHRERKDTRALAEMIEVQLEAITAAPERVRRLTELAELWELASEPRAALGARLRAFALASGEEKVRAELARLATTLHAEDELVAAYEDKLDRGLEPNPAGLWRKLAELHDARGQRQAATDAWEKAAQSAPTELALLRAYASRCRAQGDLPRLAAVLRRQIEATAEPARQHELLVELARFAEDELKDPAQAAWAVERQSQQAPTDRRLLARLQQLYRRAEDKPKWAAAVAREHALTREAGSADEPKLALRLAQLKLDTGGDDAGAFELLRDVLRLSPGSAEAVAALVQLGSRAGPFQGQATRLVMPLLTTRADHRALVGLLTAQVGLQSEPAERAALWGRICELQLGPLKDADSAFLSAARALREVPSDPALLQRCVAIASIAAAHEELAALLGELGATQPEGPPRAELFRALGRAQEGAGEHDEAIAAWRQVLTSLPSDAEARQHRDALLDQAGRHSELVALLHQRSQSAPPTERPAALLALAQAREKLGELDAAAETLLTLFALDQSLGALGSLERVLGKLGRHRERAEVLGRLAAAAPDGPSKTERLLQQAKALVAAGELELAVEVFSGVLRGAPREDRAVAELVTLASEPRVRAQVAVALAPAYRDPEHRWQRLAVLDVLVANAEPLTERALRGELAELYEAMGEPRQAFVERLRLVRGDVADEAARAQAERVAGAAHLEDELAGAWEDLLERQPAAPVALALNQTLARLYSGRLANPASAARRWEEVARLAPERLEPLLALGSLYREMRNFPALARVLGCQVPLLGTLEAQLAALTELAAVAESSSDWSAAAGAWRAVLQRTPGDLTALDALARLLERLALHPELAEVLKRRLALPNQSADAVADAQVRLGQLALGPLKQPDAALGFFEQALQSRPSDPAAVAGLEALLLRAPLLRAPTGAILEKVYRGGADPARLAEALELQLNGAAPARALALNEELAGLREAAGDLARAFLARAEVFKARPVDLRVRTELLRLAEATGRLEELAHLYRSQLTTDLPEPVAVELWRTVAATHQRLGQRPPAAEAWEEVSRLRPGEEEPLIALCALYREERSFALLPRLLRHRAELRSTVADQLALLLELVEVAELQLKDPGLAIESCQLALARAPDDRRTLAVLERLLEEHRHFGELEQLLQGQIRRAEEQRDQGLELNERVKLARVRHRCQSDDAGALELLTSVLRRAGDHSEALEAAAELMRAAGPTVDAAAALLEPLLERAQAWAPLLEVLSTRAGLATGQARAGFLHRVADLQQHRLGEATAALKTLFDLLRERPEEPRALERCLELAKATGAQAALAALLTQLLTSVKSDPTRVAILRPLALLHEHLGAADAAVECWQALLQLVPADEEAFAAAVRLLEGSRRWAELVAVHEARLPHARGDAERIALLSRIGAVREDSLGDARGAYSAWRRVLELAAQHPAALGRLDRLCGQLQLWTEQAELLARRIRSEPQDVLPLRLRLAEVRRARLNDRVGAVPLLAEVLQAAPGHPEAVAQLEQLLAGEADFGQVSELLLGGYRHLGDVKRLAAFLEARAGLAEVSARRRALWLELGKLRIESQGDAELGFLAVARAYRETPRDATLRAQVVELAGPAKSEESLAALLEEVLPQLTKEGVAQASLTLGGLYEGPLKDPERAAVAYQRALEPGPSVAALAGLDRVLEGLGRWPELLPVLEASLLTSPARAGRIGVLLRIASIADAHLGQPERAASALREVLSLEPSHVAAARTLEALYERTGQVARQLEILEHLLAQVPPPQRQALRLKLAHHGACTPERAITLGRELLAEDPHHREGFALLVGHFDRASRHAELGKLLRARRAVTLDPKEVASLEFQLGELAWRRLGQGEPAIAHYREVLERTRTHQGALTALVEIYASLDQKGALAQALADLADSPEAADDRGRTLLRRAEVLVELGSRDLALAAARGALEVTARAGAGAGAAEAELLRLRAVFVGYDALPEVAQTLLLLADTQVSAAKPAQAVTTLLELASTQQRLDQLGPATAALQRVLLLEPSNREAFDEARGLYGRGEAWAQTAQLLSAFLAHLQPAELPVTLDELAELHELQLKDPAAAFGWACQAVRLDPTPTSRRERVERLAKSLGRPAELAGLYLEILEALPYGPTYARLALALAAIQDAPLDQVDAAEKTLRGLLAHDAANQAALDALVGIFARRALHARHAGALEQKLDATIAQSERASLLKALAQLHEEKLGDARAAALALTRLVELCRDADSAGLLAALHLRHRQWAQALEALEQKVRLSPPAGRAAVQLVIAALCEQELKDVEAAVAGYLQALAFEPTSSPAFVALHRLYQQLGRPAELLRAIEQRLTLTIDLDEQVALLYQAAALWEAKAAPLQADQRLERLLKVRPTEERALEELERLRREGERWPALADVLSRHVPVAQRPLQKATLCGQLGQLHHQQLRDDDAAVAWWRRALEHVADHRPALKALAQLHQLHERWLEATRMIDREALLEKDPHQRAELSHRSAVLLEEKLRDLAGASAGYQRALGAHQTHLPSLRRLRALYQREGNWPGFEQTLVQEAEHAPTAADRAAAGLELGRHLQTRARDERGAIRWYEHALANDPKSIDAARPLTDLLLAASDWRKASQSSRVLISLLEQGGPSQQPELIRRVSRLGDVERELGHIGLSLQTYEQALKLDPNEPGALRGVGELLELAGRAGDAAQHFERLLQHHERTLPAADRAGLRVRLSRLYQALGETDRARSAVEKALTADPGHAVALRLAIELSDGAATWDTAAAYRQRLAAVTAGEERYQLLFELGKLALDKLAKPTLAITGFAAALELRPDSLEVLERLHLAYRAAGQLQKSAQLLEQLVAHPKLPDESRELATLALAELLSGSLKEETRAVGVLEAALDRSPQFSKALKLLESLLTASKRWKSLNECETRQLLRLERVPGTGPQRAVLWRALGDLRAHQLRDTAGALDAYSAGARLAPDDAAMQEALGDYAIAQPEHEAEAIAAYVRAIPNSPNPARLCGILARAAQKRGDHDSMVLAAGAAGLVGTPGPEEVRIVREFARTARGPAQLRAPVSDVQWQTLLLHPSLRGSLGQLMALIFSQAGAKYAADLGDFKLHPKKHRIELADSKEPALANLRFIARALGFEGLNLYSPFLASRLTGRAERHPDEAVGLRVNPTTPLSFFVGEPLLREPDLQQLTAHVAATVALLRPELSMAVLLAPEGLAAVIEAALTFGDASYAPRIDPKLLKAEQKRLGKALTPEGKTALSRLASNVLRTSGRANLTATYFDAVRHTASRAALLLAGDFAAVQARALPMQSARAQLFVRELAVFAVGGELHTLRVETGSQLAGR